MIKFLQLLLVCLLLPLYGFSDWMLEQIREDLAPFQEAKIHKRDLVQEMEKVSAKEKGLLLIEITNNTISWASDPIYHDHERLQAVTSFFERLAASHSLPNISLLICLLDDYKETSAGRDVPVLAFAKCKGTTSILFPDFEALNDGDDLIASCKQFASDHPWKSKRPLFFWRGASTGALLTEQNYADVPRVKLVQLSQLYSEWLDASFTHLCQATEFVMSELERYRKPSVPIKDHFQYKYLIDIDGNSCTYTRCRWILLSNSTLIKQESPNIQWYYKTLKPYEHYVPCNTNLEDLPSVYQWLKSHDRKTHLIAKNGKMLAREIFSQSAIDAYVIKLIEEYAKIYRN